MQAVRVVCNVHQLKTMKLRSLAFAALLLAALPSTSSLAAVAISVNLAPPPLPVVVQPPCPVDGYLWAPGYWAYGDYGYYWVPGYWAAPPTVGLLWTPPWWGFVNGVYVFNRGYWGPRVGFYGGINYGYGYFGRGFDGGYWTGNVFRYNTAVVRVNKTVIHNTYVNRTVIRNSTRAGRVSFNGGPNGVKAVATAQEKAAERQRRAGPTAAQLSRQQAANKNRDLQASANNGHPKVTNQPGEQGQKTKVAQQQTKAASENAAKKAKAEAAARRANAARGETRAREEQQVRAAERQREVARNARERQADVRSREARERENAAARRRMTERSRRPEAVSPRDGGQGNRGQSSDQQRKRKQKRDQDSDDRR
jgi:hypothetical protein